MLHVAGVATFDLDTAACFLLDMFHVRPTMTHDLGSQIEARDGFEVDGNPLFGPFALQNVS